MIGGYLKSQKKYVENICFVGAHIRNKIPMKIAADDQWSPLVKLTTFTGFQ